jgi:hypothetical protein
MLPVGYTCLAEADPFTILIQRSADGLWTMQLLDRRGSGRIVMPPSEFGLPEAKQKAIISARYYMRKYGGDASWTEPNVVAWQEFAPKSVIWET